MSLPGAWRCEADWAEMTESKENSRMETLKNGKDQEWKRSRMEKIKNGNDQEWKRSRMETFKRKKELR